MPRVLVTTDYLKPGDAVDEYLRSAGLETLHRPLVGTRDPQELVRLLDGVEAALIANEPMSADVLEQATSLRVIVRTGVGYDSVDIGAAARRGITVSNLPGINANAVAEYTIGLLLAAARRLVQSARGVASGSWPREDGHELRGATLGIVGYGASGRAVAALAGAFGMTVLCHTSIEPVPSAAGVEFVGFDELLTRSDYVSIHTALTDRTRGLFDAAAFAAMKPTAMLINTARGPIVDEDALAEAVRGGEIAGAALDVVATEPLPLDSPLRELDEVVVYSHLAGQTAQARAAAGLEGAAELVAALRGEPRFCVNQHLMEESA